MILTGEQIKKAREYRWLDISDWDEKRLNPNSYNLRLADELLVYRRYQAENEFDLLECPFKNKYGEVDHKILTRKQVWEMGENGELPKSVVDHAFDAYRERNSSHRKETLLSMKQTPWDMETYRFEIPETGFVIKPGVLYLGRTMEYTETHKFVPMLEGRSSVGRLGISVHSTAGFGDIGFCGYWTLEISCVQPVRIYPGVDICQIYYHTVADNDEFMRCGMSNVELKKYDGGKYQNNTGIQPSMMWKEFK